MIAQFGIAIFGVIAIWLANSLNPLQQRWASVYGLIGTPFFLFAGITDSQWGMVVVSTICAVAWAKGFHQHWIR